MFNMRKAERERERERERETRASLESKRNLEAKTSLASKSNSKSKSDLDSKSNLQKTTALDYLSQKFSAFFYKHEIIFWCIFAFILARYFALSYVTATTASPSSSLDMQYYPTLQLWGMAHFSGFNNPYALFLTGDTFLANGANYMPHMYFLMFPFALLDWEAAKSAFAFFNLFLFIATLALWLKSGTSRVFVCFVGIFVMLGYTFGNVIGNAQSTIMIGFFLSLAYIYRKNPWVLSIALAMVCMKHSFGAAIIIGFFIAGYKKECIYAVVLCAVFACIFGAMVGENPINIIHQMLQVNSASYIEGSDNSRITDIFSLSQKVFGTPFSPFIALQILLIASLYYFKVKFKLEDSRIIAASVILSLIILPHIGYDHYILFIALLVLKDEFKATSIQMLFLAAITAFLYRGGMVKGAIDKILCPLDSMLGYGCIETHWAMNMGLSFCILFVVLFSISFYLILARKTTAIH